MRKFYYLKTEIKKTDVFIKEHGLSEKTLDSELRGKKMIIPKNELVFYNKGKNRTIPDVIFGTFSNVIISDSFKDVLKNVDSSNLQFLDCKLIDLEDQIKPQNLTYLNFLNNLSCLDRNKSTYEKFHPEYDIITKINKLVLDKSSIPSDRHIFRLEENSPIILFSEELYEIINLRFTGIRFSAV